MPKSLTTEEMFGPSLQKKKKALTSEEMFNSSPAPRSEKAGFSPKISTHVNPETGRNYVIPGKNIVEYGIEGAAHVLHPVLRYVDKYTGAPIRSFVDQLQKDEDMATALLAARKQVGENPDNVPSGAQIAARASLSERKMEFPFPWSKEMPPEMRSGISQAELGGIALSPLTEPQLFILPPALKGAAKLSGAAASEIIAKIPTKTLNEIIDNRTLKASVGGQNVVHFRKMTRTSLQSPGDVEVTKARISQQARDILAEENLIGWLENSENIQPKLAAARKKWGEEVGKIGKQIDDMVPGAVDMKKVSDKIRKYANDIDDVSNGPEIKEDFYKHADRIEAMGNVSFKKAQTIKGMFKHSVTEKDLVLNSKKSTNKIKNIITKEMEDTVDDVAKKALDFDVIQMVKAGEEIMAPVPGLIPPGAADSFSLERGIYEAANFKTALEDYLIAKRKYGTFKAAADAASDRFNKSWTNNLFTPSSWFMGGTAATTLASSGNIAMSLPALAAGMVINKLIRDRGAALAARTADKAVKIIEKSQKEVMKRRLEKKGK